MAYLAVSSFSRSSRFLQIVDVGMGTQQPIREVGDLAVQCLDLGRELCRIEGRLGLLGCGGLGGLRLGLRRAGRRSCSRSDGWSRRPLDLRDMSDVTGSRGLSWPQGGTSASRSASFVARYHPGHGKNQVSRRLTSFAV